MKSELDYIQTTLPITVNELPRLPSVIRYFDEFNDKIVAINNPEQQSFWNVVIGGKPVPLNFEKLPEDLVYLLKSWVTYLIHNKAPATASIHYNSLLSFEAFEIREIILSGPLMVKEKWSLILARGHSNKTTSALKSLLHFICDCNIGGWSKEYSENLSTLPLPAADKYASVRTGEVILDVGEESILVAYIDDQVNSVRKNQQKFSDENLRNLAALICSYQFGLRPTQIGRLQMKDVKIWDVNETGDPSVHLTFKKVKQRSRTQSYPLPRRVKLDWVSPFVEIFNRNIEKGFSGNNLFLGFNDANEVSVAIADITESILPNRRTATELRHTAAQRLVDAGASHEELAEFMGHSDIDTGLVYFQQSANQAERVNSALGISEIYQSIARIAHDQFIDLETLSKLKGEQQIGAIPHGIPISGIGGCSSGQPACQFNPVMSCYGCRKFMPINDASVHESVLSDFRSIVTFFEKASLGEQNSPAYMQLKRTISNVQSIIQEIQGGQE